MSVEITEETKTLVTILRHQGLVRSYLTQLAMRLHVRATNHDLSKFREDEFSGFVEINQTARNKALDSPEYKASITKAVVGLHHSRNPHHPEFYIQGVKDMTLFDIVEMVVDWLAASQTYGNTSFEESLEIQAKRFEMTPEQVWLVKLIASELSALRTVT